MKKTKVMFVCMGNICRSPTAHAVFRDLAQRQGLAEQIEIASSGTHAYHVGEQADRRSRAVANQRGIEIDDLRAQKITAQDLEYYDYILAMDRDNLAIVESIARPEQMPKIKLFLSYASDKWRTLEVPDPYYQGRFEEVFDMIADASNGLLSEIKKAL
jgi:protein-tyrosine phosphatase